ncbi:MAG: TIGR04282 family arsenosugar biosynthesis glycosyltransferase [Alphaproteobacteria bacterium]|nr:TIGR04282 family arsenosugar biosynthesis glycosyltransferase [Alphaproteobacteria bacterium]
MASTRILALVYAKPPRAGAVKTRLAATMGADVAAEVARALLSDTWRLLRDVPWLDVVLSTPEPGEDHGVDAIVWDQGGGDLGQRLERGFRRGLLEHDAVIALGGDAPHLPVTHLQRLVDALEEHDAAIGPTADGGFWGLGLRRCPPGLLADIPWSTASTLDATVARLADLDPIRVDPWWDVDEEADLRRMRAEIPRERVPLTSALLDRLWD